MSRLLAVLFLFINCVCAAAPILKLTGEGQADAVSTKSLQVPNPLENEEENHSSISGYINHAHRFSVRNHCDKLICESIAVKSDVLFSDISLPDIHTHDNSILPTLGTDAFLFRYNLF